MSEDLFSTLAHYAFRQEENFLTEAWVYLIKQILDREKTLGISLLGKFLSFPAQDIQLRQDMIEILTQVTFAVGRPDIVVRVGDDSVFYIEVKHDSRIGEYQLKDYLEALEREDAVNKKLILLTRSRNSVQETKLGSKYYHHVCWYEISGWLSELQIKDEVANYLVEEFLSFLREKEMSMERISWEFIKGVPAFRNLTNMLGLAVEEAYPELNVRRTIGWDWIGYYLGEDLDIWVGFYYISHLTIVMANNKGVEPSVKKKLDLNEKHFFSLDAGEQLELLINFVRTNYPEVSTVENKENKISGGGVKQKPIYRLRLSKTYYNEGFFNLGVDVERFITYDEGPITILVGEDRQEISGRVTRKANQNGTPRIFGGAELRDWFQENFKRGEIGQVVILEPDRVWIR